MVQPVHVASAGGGVPGVVVWLGWAGRAIPGTTHMTLQDPYLTIFSLKEPTHGQMKAFYEVSMRFLRYGLRIDPY